jgi:hypothetical protein
MNEHLIPSSLAMQGPSMPGNGVLELAGAPPVWMSAHTCRTPGCQCRTAKIMASHDGEQALLRYQDVFDEAMQSGQSCTLDASADLILFDLDIDSANVFALRGTTPLDLARHPAIGEIAKRINGDVLESLGRQWYRNKGWPDPEEAALRAPTIEVKGWKRGQRLGWDEACHGVRIDLYEIDGVIYDAIDFYCLIPSCTCDKVVIHFAAPDGIESPGDVIVHLSGKIEMNSSKRGHALLGRLWARYRQRHTDHLARLSRRYETMKSVGERVVVELPAVSHKVGRNEPCPCGSGMKYKKCCATAL